MLANQRQKSSKALSLLPDQNQMKKLSKGPCIDASLSNIVPFCWAIFEYKSCMFILCTYAFQKQTKIKIGHVLIRSKRNKLTLYRVIHWRSMQNVNTFYRGVSQEEIFMHQQVRYKIRPRRSCFCPVRTNSDNFVFSMLLNSIQMALVTVIPL